MSRALFDAGRFGARDFDSAFESLFGVRPRTVAEADSDDDLAPADLPALPVSQEDGE